MIGIWVELGYLKVKEEIQNMTTICGPFGQSDHHLSVCRAAMNTTPGASSIARPQIQIWICWICWETNWETNLHSNKSEPRLHLGRSSRCRLLSCLRISWHIHERMGEMYWPQDIDILYHLYSKTAGHTHLYYIEYCIGYWLCQFERLEWERNIIRWALWTY